MSKTSIEWTRGEDGSPGFTWNPITGCTRHSPGCDHCYSARMTYRLETMGQEKYAGLTVVNPRGDRHFNGQVKTHPDVLVDPLGWKKPRRIFVCSMSDIFHRDVPFEFVDRVFATMALCPQHEFQVLTKRPDRMAEYFEGMECDGDDAAGQDVGHRLSSAAGMLLDGPWIWNKGKKYRKRIESFITDSFGEFDGFDDEDPDYEFKPIPWPLPNVWLGTSIEDQKRVERIHHLLKCPAAIRFLSVEPLLESVDIDRGLGYADPGHCESDGYVKGVDWVIIGAESGPGRRPMKLEWAQSIVDQCKAAGVAIFVKQIEVGGKVTGEIDEFPESLRVREFPKAIAKC